MSIVETALREAHPSRKPEGARNVVAGPITFVGLRHAAGAPKRRFTSEAGGYLG